MNIKFSEEECDRAFNVGCDARIIGEPFSWCAFDDLELKKYWKLGWKDVDRNWGKNAKKNTFRRLPKIYKDE